MTYYVAEIQNAGSYREADKIEASSLAAAKRIASRNQCFDGTVLEIAESVNEQEFIIDPIARKENGRWS
jgi:hypothetical protein